MKKVSIAILLVLTFVAYAVAMAESISLSEMSDEELTAVYEESLKEMKERGLLASGILSPGKYVVGNDIAEGIYNISAADSIASYYFIFPTQESYDLLNELKNLISITIRPLEVGANQPIRLDLQIGNILYLPTNSAKIERINDTLKP